MNKEISLYVHIPFCAKKCGYCDFVSFSGREKDLSNYVDALIKEINKRTKDVTLKTIFIGGGTPTHLPDIDFERLLKTINKISKVYDYEYTCEANPESLTISKLELMKTYGVNRISIGLQTTDDFLLKNIGRIHNYKTFLKAYYNARKYIPSISFDLITALPGQNFKNIKETLNEAIRLNPDHISVYSLILEEGTEFYKKVSEGSMVLPTEEEDRLFQEYAREVLNNAGFKQYEISNYAKKNHECLHNINYWKCGESVGVGVAAAGYENGIRYVNTSSIEEYIYNINNDESVRTEENIVSLKDAKEEFIFMGMRMNEGISIDEFNKKFNANFLLDYKEILEKYIKTNHLILDSDRLYFSNEGFNISNYILSDFIL